MWDFLLSIDWKFVLSSILVPLGIAVIGAVAAYRGAYLAVRHNQTEIYRDKLYSLQVDAYDEVVERASDILDMLVPYSYKILHGSLAEEERRQMRLAVERFDTTYRKFSTVLPDAVLDRAIVFTLHMGMIRAFLENDPGYSSTEEDPIKDFWEHAKSLKEAFWGMINEMRTSLGTETLSSETMARIGSTSPLR